jgi:ferritin-like metal-binding protein YciE
MEMESLRDLYVEELKDVLNAEKQLIKALPKMAKAATHVELRSAFQDHLAVTEEQVLDAALISSAQRVEHYEIAAYGTLRTYARTLGLDSHARLLQQSLDEEGEADKLLTQIAESTVNVDAEMGEPSDVE